MANNKTTYTLQIDAELGQLEKKLNDVRGLMTGVLGSAQAPKGLEKAFEKVEGLLDRIKGKASQPITSKTGFSSIEKDVSSANVALAGLLKVVSQISTLSESAQISFLPKGAQDQLNTIITSLAAYQSAIDTATTETAELAAARRDLAKAEGEVANAQARLENRESKLSSAKQSRDEAQAEIDAIKAREKALEELYEEQKKIEEFYSKPDEQGQKRKRSKKYTEVSMRPQDIKKKITELEGASAGDAQALQRWNEQLKSAKNNVESYGRQVDTAKRTLEDSKEGYTSLIDKVAELEKTFNTNSIEQQQKAFTALRAKADELGISLEDISESYSESDAKALVNRFADLKARGLEPVAQAADKAEKEAREMGEVLETTKGKIEGATESFEGMAEAARQQQAFETKIKQFLGLSGAAQVLRAALRDAMQTIAELDKTMTEMSVVTSLGVGDYWDQLPQYTERANKLGLAINDVYKADTLFYQQGLKTNEVVAISTETMKMARIAGLDTAEATDRMTAALRGFNMELNETSAKKVADVYSELAAITAADVDEISTAMTKTASIASSAGMEFETTAAFLSQIIETTRESAETAGTAMKTVIARFQELKKAPDEIGEIDGEIIDANAIETALRSVGVALRDSSGQFRELDDVFLELSSKWDELDKNTQRYIATIAAGSRQQSRFIAMMSDYGRTQELVASANKSAGASNEQFEKTAESLEFKINQLKNAWHEFTMGIMNSDLVKFGVDLLTKFLEIVNKATSGLDGLGGSISKLATVFAIFKMASKVFDKFKPTLINMFSFIVEQAGLKGYDAGKKFAQEAERGAQEALQENTQSSAQPTNSKQEEKSEKETNGILRALGNASGAISITGAFAAKKEARANLEMAQQQSNSTRAALSAAQRRKAEASHDYRDSTGAIKQHESALKERLKANQQARQRGEKVSYGKENTKAYDAKSEYKQTISDATKAEKEHASSLAKLSAALTNFKAVSAQSWEEINAGISKAAQGITALGIGFSLVGGVLSSLGLEGLGETLSTIGNVITVIGTALSLIPPILTVIQALLSAPPLGIIVLILAAVIAAILIIVAIFKSFSPEKKLEKAAKAAEEAAEEAERASEAYENLVSSLDELGEKYKVLDELTKGTKEWNQAVQDINNSVLDLINEYPALAGLVKMDGGVLKLDTESEEVQKVINAQRREALVAQNYALIKKIDVGEAKKEVAKSDLGRGAKLNSDKQTDALAQALARGIVAQGENGFETLDSQGLKELGLNEDELPNFYEQLGDNVDKLKEYGKQIEETTAQQKAAYQAMATQIIALSDTSNLSDQEKNQVSNVFTADNLAEIYRQSLDEVENDGTNYGSWGNNKKEQSTKEEAAQAMYGSAVRVKGRRIIMPDGTTKKMTDDEWEQFIANYRATGRSEEAVAALPGAVDKLIEKTAGGDEATSQALEKAFEDSSGQKLTKADMEKIQQASLMSESEFNKLTQAEKDALGGSYELLAEKYNEVKKNSKEVWNELEYDMKHFGVDFDKVTAEATKGLFENLEQVSKTSGEEMGKSVAKLTQELFDAREGRHEEIAARINATDWTSIESLNDLSRDLINVYDVEEEQVKKYIQAITKGTHATSRFTYTIEEFGEFYVATEKLNSALKKATEAEWEYQTAIQNHQKLNKDLITEMGQEHYKAFQAGQEMKSAARLDLLRAYGEGSQLVDKNNSNFTSQWHLDENNQLVHKDGLSMSNYKHNYLSEDQSKQFDEWVKNISDQVDKIEEGEDAQKEAIEALYDLQSQSEDSYYELRDLIKEALNSDMQKFIDLQQEEIDATKETADAIASKIQDQIDQERQNRQNTEQLEKISEAQERLAYLKMDTSGLNDLEILALQDEISAMEQEYTDSLIDQKLDEFVDANQLAYDQREEQIRLLQQQSTAFSQSEAFQQLTNDLLARTLEGNQGVTSWLSQYHTQGMSNQEAEKWNQELQNTSTLASFFTNGVYVNEKTGEMYTQNQSVEVIHDKEGNVISRSDYNALSSEEQQNYRVTSGKVNISRNGTASISWKDSNNFDKTTQLEGTFEHTSFEAQATKINEQRLENDAATEESASRISRLTAVGFNPYVLSQASEERLALYEKFYNDAIIGRLGGKKATQQGINGINPSNVSKYLGQINNNTALDQEADRIYEQDIWTYSFPKDMMESMHIKFGAITNEVKTNSPNYVVDVKMGLVSDESVMFTNTHLPLFGEAKLNEKLGSDAKQGAFIAIPHEQRYADYFGATGLIGYYKGHWRSVIDEFPNNKIWDEDYSNDTQRNKERILDPSLYSYSTENTLLPSDLYKFTENGTALSKYKTGGLADFTGPAWLDGTPSKPEYVLNAAQTERFFSLVDILDGFDKKAGDTYQGETNIDIDINVEKIANDYDVEQLANKIRSMLYKDASYRNVNNVSNIR